MSSTTEDFSRTKICKWCTQNRSDLVFETANLCNGCYEIATAVVQNPTLCMRCRVLLTDEGVIRDLFSKNEDEDEDEDEDDDKHEDEHEHKDEHKDEHEHEGEGYWHSDAKYLQTSSEGGCGFCRMLLLLDPNPDPQRLTAVPIYLTANRKKKWSNPRRTVEEFTDFFGRDIRSFYFGSERNIPCLKLSVSANADDPAAGHVSQRPPETNLGSDRINQQIREWLRKCLEEHPESRLCNDTQLPRLPTRVIDVGSQFDHQCKLFHPSVITHQRYVTLSYCWGTPEPLKTTNNNISSHKERLDEAALPQTFRDAIATTRSLGLRYLWIDSLCIIQDNDEDKKNEISAMGEIYSNSSLTIAAVSARGATEGFLQTRPQLSVEIPYRCPSGEIGSVRVSPQRTVDLWQEPLFTRGWCLQESLLSRRMLLYTDVDVIWQCQSRPMQHHNTANVTYIDGNPLLTRSPFRRLPEHVLYPAENHAHVDDHIAEEERYNIWTSIVGDYTRRNLSRSLDRLPALDGIARKFEVRWSDKYLSGHWESQFIPMLSWQRKTVMRGTSFIEKYYLPVSEYRAPSWSWASIDGPVEFARISLLGDTRGLRAKLISFVPGMNSKSSDTAVLEASMIRATSIPSRGSKFSLDAFLNIHSLSAEEPRLVASHVDEEVWGATWCMFLGEGYIGGSKKSPNMFALLLTPVLTPVANGNFKRIGLYESSVKVASKLWTGDENRRIVNIE